MTGGPRVALAFHPGSGRGAAARLAGAVASRLRPHVARLDVIDADTVEGARQRLEAARESGLDALVVVGGDGAAHLAVQFCAGTPVALGLVPSGTGNDLARALDVPGDPAAAVDSLAHALRTGHRRRLDLGRAGDTWYGTVLCSGFDAAVNDRANRLRWPRGPRRYDVAIAAEIASFRARDIRVTADGETLTAPAMLVAVGNTPWYGAGIPVCPGADPTDGLLDVTVVGKVGYRELARVLPRLRTGRHVEHPAVTTLRARTVEVADVGRAGGADWPVFADGDPLGTLPVSISCVPRALTVLA
ncbi:MULTISPECIES: diacylglycerol/lipid kinase family protein [Prauserella salsuginis group]|uniref:Diacylglycerol kinase (ATP) n=2 Tax=Prauserella salsuginis group TaxID=2893672 RepID=A0A839Y2X9_9PSEU|nr:MULTISPECIES: diacylglycerol kinase family protein [Prauserella salsuginis group]MBB3666275.1 diacylglycerol kinase (ATP) [Prauserella sediminis]MCR3718205.1 diacylglycerol kinase (ATP) [Prauserella flava]MCR3732775.1 diacylglycerol kinase (ATP) [Prauserella salsuginis]